MAHFVKLDENNIVTAVEVVSNDIAVTEQAGIDFQRNHHNEPNANWKQTSYNTIGGIHYEPNSWTPSADQSKAFRKNYAAIGDTYDPVRDAFIPPKPFNSWILNENSCTWDAPVPYPDDGQRYEWDEDTNNWVLETLPTL